MRIRRVEVEWGTGSAMVDFRNEGGIPLPAVAITGNSGTGKTLLQRLSTRLIHGALFPNSHYDNWGDFMGQDSYKNISGYVELEYGGAISTGVVKNGSIIQCLIAPDTVFKGYILKSGYLAYNSFSRSLSAMDFSDSCLSFGEAIVRTVLQDLYKGDIRNSIIWVDDFDLGLDDSGSKKFLETMIRKGLERDNQVIISTARRELISIVGDGERVLAGGTNVVERVLKGLS